MTEPGAIELLDSAGSTFTWNLAAVSFFLAPSTVRPVTSGIGAEPTPALTLMTTVEFFFTSSLAGGFWSITMPTGLLLLTGLVSGIRCCAISAALAWSSVLPTTFGTDTVTWLGPSFDVANRIPPISAPSTNSTSSVNSAGWRRRRASGGYVGSAGTRGATAVAVGAYARPAFATVAVGISDMIAVTGAAASGRPRRNRNRSARMSSAL